MVGLVSDVGLRRKLNEDSACYLKELILRFML